MSTAASLLLGIVGGGVTITVARAFRSRARAITAAVLMLAAGGYVALAALGGASTQWLLIDSVGLAVYGAAAIAGVRGSVWWLVAAWALHPLWDFGLHHLGPGRTYAPLPYVMACITFDWVVAAYIFIAYRFGFASHEFSKTQSSA